MREAQHSNGCVTANLCMLFCKRKKKKKDFTKYTSYCCDMQNVAMKCAEVKKNNLFSHLNHMTESHAYSNSLGVRVKNIAPDI